MRYDDGMGEEKAAVAGEDLAGVRVDIALTRLFPEFSRTFAQRLLSDRLVEVDGQETKAAARLRGGEALSVFVPEPVAMSAEPEDIPLAVLYEDDDLLVVDKAPNLVVHPSPGHERGTLVNALAWHCRGLSALGGALRPGIVHRLDRDTSGCLVVAKNDAAHQALSAQFAGRQVDKVYLALTRGTPRPTAGAVEGRIGKDPRDRKRMAMLPAGGRHSLTLYRVAESFGGVALVECDLKTGRTHQIRVHLRHVHAPILCDADYGAGGRFTAADARETIEAWLGKAAAARQAAGRAGPAGVDAATWKSLEEAAAPLRRTETAETSDVVDAGGAAKSGSAAPAPADGDEVLLARQGLHAWKLDFTHPSTGARIHCEAPLPPDMSAVLAALRHYRDAR